MGDCPRGCATWVVGVVAGCEAGLDPDFESVDRMKNNLCYLSTDTFMRLISDNLSFKDDNFQTVMVERNGYDQFYLQFNYDGTQKESQLVLERLSKDIVSKDEVVVERTEGTGIHMASLRFEDNERKIVEFYKQAKSHVRVVIQNDR